MCRMIILNRTGVFIILGFVFMLINVPSCCHGESETGEPMGEPHPSSSSVNEDLSLSLPSSSSNDIQQSHESSSTTTDHIDNLIETNTVDDALLNDFEKVTREVSNNTLPIENASHLVDNIKNEVTNITKDVIIDESVESFNFSTQEVATSAALDLEETEMSHSLSAASEGTLSHPVSSPSIEPTAPMESPSEPGGAANPLDANATDDNDVDDDIETFEEFKNRKNQDVPNIQQQVLGNIPKGGNNNFASHECGAKVIATNPEAKNPGAILTNNNDEYMLNPCSAEIWFVIELCELVSVSKFEIGCFELFSSIPESFAVYTSDSFPTSKWESLGSFLMREERGVQEFPLADTVYAKYIKVVMLKHFGSEHYCPVSMVRVYGATMMEEYEYTESQREQLNYKPDKVNQLEQLVATIKEDPNEKEFPDSSKGNPLLAAATNVIFSAINKAVNGLMGSEKPVPDEVSPIQSTIDCTDEASISSEIVMSTTCHTNTSSFNNSIPTSSSIPLGPTSMEIISSISPSETQTDQSIESSITSELPAADVISTSSSSSSLSSSSVSSLSSQSLIDSNSITAASNTDMPPPVNDSTISSSLEPEPSQSLDAINTTKSNESNDTMTTDKSNSTVEQISLNHTNTSTAGGDEGNSANGSPREKSVFLRLSNRINNLELNISLLSSYLDQVSASLKRNKNKTEDMQRSLERRMSLLNVTMLQAQVNDTILIQLNETFADLKLSIESLHNENTFLMQIMLLIVCGIALLEGLLLICCCASWSCYHLTSNRLQHSLKNIENQLKASQEHEEGTIANGAVATTLSHQKQSLEHKLTCNDEEHQPVTLTDESSHSLISNISSHHSEQWQKVPHKKKRKSHNNKQQ